MYYMFYNASSFNSDLTNWNTSAVTDMSNMFNGASSFNRDLQHPVQINDLYYFNDTAVMGKWPVPVTVD